MAEIIVLIGISGSGKSTLAKEHCNVPRTIRVNRDDTRLQLFNAKQSDASYYNRKDFKDCELLVTETIDDIIYNALNKDLNVVIDNTNLQLSYINEIISKFNHLAHISLEIVSIDTKEAKERIRNRNGIHFNTDYIDRQANDFAKLKKELFGKVLFYPQVSCKVPTNTDGPSAFLFDIDGTLAIKGDRNIFDDSKLHLDTLIEPVAHVLDAIDKSGHKVIFLSGRQDSCKDTTTKWLIDNGLWKEGSEIHMRRAKDGRKDSIVKEELFKANIAPRFNVQGIFDDRESVTRNWAKLGVFCFNVNQLLVKF